MKIGIQKEINFDFDYSNTSDHVVNIDNITYLGNCFPPSVTNWKDILDVQIINQVWDNEEEYQQGGGTTTTLEPNALTESGRHYICDVLFSVKEEYQDRYEMIDYMKQIQLNWTKP